MDVSSESPRSSTDTKGRRSLWAGFVFGLLPELTGVLFGGDALFPNLFQAQAQVIAMMLLFALPLWLLAALITSIVPATRRFGLGMWLGIGVGWLLIWAICFR